MSPLALPQRPLPARLTMASVLAAATALALSLAPHSAAFAEPTTEGTIAFVSEVDGDDEIAIMSADGARTRVLTDNVGPDRVPSWSAAGDRLVFNSRREPHGTRPQIYALDPSTGATTRLSNSSAEDQRAALSSDGTTLYLQRGVFFVEPYNLVALDLESLTETMLTADVDPQIWNAAPAPSPDGRWLLFQSNRDAPTPSGPFPQRLFALDVSTSTITALPFGDGLDADDSVDGPRWSADGTEFVYSSGGRIFVGEAIGDDPSVWPSAPVTDGDEDSSPSLSPDGSAIVFQTYVEGDDPDGDEDTTLIRVIERSTGDIVTLGEGRTPVWTAEEWLPAEAINEQDKPELADTGSREVALVAAIALMLIALGTTLRVRRRQP